ncbi:hypothetical protein L596_020585 [Steinernema carpocapsae]|uniref:HAT C-terminal dimerisation domain-containing protein n=1 Tax=Steinernema carpocapsae TaxID=34508 RepID=A0A4U5MTZ3_STECR|nr:hypothetical protein L596_020585 [Steinernema carpocapsae]
MSAVQKAKNRRTQCPCPFKGFQNFVETLNLSMNIGQLWSETIFWKTWSRAADIQSTLLDPSFKLHFMEFQYHKSSRDVLIKLAEDLAVADASSSKVNRGEPDNLEEETLEEVSLDGLSFFDYFKSSELPDISPIAQTSHVDVRIKIAVEIEEYLKLPCESRKSNPLEYWNRPCKSAKLPILRRLATKFLSAPATSAESERLFSAAALTLTDLQALAFIKAEVFTKPTETFTEATNSTVFLVQLTDSTQIYVENLEIIHRQTVDRTFQCFGQSPTTGNEPFCKVYECSESATHFCAYPHLETIALRTSARELDITAWSARVQTIYREPTQVHRHPNCSAQLKCEKTGIKVVQNENKLCIPLQLQLTFYIYISRIKSTISFQADKSECTTFRNGHVLFSYDKTTMFTVDCNGATLNDDQNRPQGKITMNVTPQLQCVPVETFYKPSTVPEAPKTFLSSTSNLVKVRPIATSPSVSLNKANSSLRNDFDGETKKCHLDPEQIKCHPADDKMGYDATGNSLLQKALIDNKLPQIIEGNKVSKNGRPTLETQATVSLQLIVQKLVVECRVDHATCAAVFQKLEGAYGVPSGAKIFYSCKSNFSLTSAFVECPSGSFNIMCTNPDKERTNTIYLASQDVDEVCTIRCPAHVSTAHLQGHLAHLNENAGGMSAWIKKR